VRCHFDHISGPTSGGPDMARVKGCSPGTEYGGSNEPNAYVSSRQSDEWGSQSIIQPFTQRPSRRSS
jgi:hypothetical protein